MKWRFVFVSVLAGALLSACSSGGIDSLRAEVQQPVQKSVDALASPTDQPAQPVEVVVTTTPAPEIVGFQSAGVDESVKPCPIKFWKRGRCVATDAQMQDASEVTQ